MLDAALELFTTQGYAATSVARVAERADVALKTVYVSVGGKADLVMALMDRGLDLPMDRWTASRSELAPADAEHFLRQTVERLRVVFDRSLPVVEIMIEAARSDAAVAERSRATSERFRERLDVLASLLSASGSLRSDVDEAAAQAILTFYLAPRSWRALLDAEWDFDRAERWLSEQIVRALLP